MAAIDYLKNIEAATQAAVRANLETFSPTHPRLSRRSPVRLLGELPFSADRENRFRELNISRVESVRLLRSSVNVFFNTPILNFPSIFVGIDLCPFGVIMRTHLRVDMFPGSDSGHHGVEKERLAR